MTQSLAIFLDAYRELNARKMFWISLLLSGIFIALFAMVGVSDDKLSFLTWEWPMPFARIVYKSVLLKFVLITIWMTWGAVILALISTASTFPDLLSQGAIDLYVAKPISRLRLFVTKYFAALLSVLLQAIVFSVSAFLLVGWRAQEWKPGLLLAIPLITLFFSYLFSVCVLIGVWTRSSLTALLLTLLVWLATFGLQAANAGVSLYENQNLSAAEVFEERVADADDRLKSAGATTQPGGGFDYSTLRKTATDKAREFRQHAEAAAPWRKLIHYVRAPSPKTWETTGLLDENLFSVEEKQDVKAYEAKRMRPRRGKINDNQMWIQEEINERTAERMHQLAEAETPLWIIGSSVAFEAVVLGFAAWIFCRRDY